MFCLKLEIRPTAALTFRRIPFATVHLATYPFVPPTTLSGFLRRLWILAEGLELPLTGEHAEDDLNRYFVLPREFCTLGAYPLSPQLPSSLPIHRTKRHGVRELTHTEFSKLRRRTEEKNLQLYTWEYFLCDRLVGYVVHSRREPLQALAEKVHNRGCKLGKEGFAYVARVEGPIQLEEKEIEAVPSVFLTGQDALGVPGDVYYIYRYEWEGDEGRAATEGWLRYPSPIKGFRPLPALFTRERVKRTYLTDGKTIFIPLSTVQALNGEAS